MKKIIAMLTLSCMLILVGCANVSYPQESSAVDTSKPTSMNIYEELESILPTLSEENQSFEENSHNSQENTPQTPKETPFVIVTNKASAFQNQEGSTSMVVSAIETRNEFLKEKYGAVVEVKEMTYSEISKELKNAIASGLDFCDMLAISAEDTAKLYKSGLLEDLNTLPDFDATSQYFDQKNATKLATNSTLYMIPDPTALYYEDLQVVFYNKELVKLPEGVESLEKLVLEGNWTWEKFDEICRLSASEVYNKSIADLGSDLFAYTAYSDDNTFPLAMFASTGERVVDNTYKHAVEITMDGNRANEICNLLLDVYDTKGRYPFDGNTALEAFENGRSVFFFNTYDYFYALRDGSAEESKYGFLPMPKENQEQEGYYSFAMNSARVISVPKTLSDDDEAKRKFVSAVISATCAIGGPTVREAFINSQIMLYLYNNTETLMLQNIIDGAFFDFSYIIGSLYSDIADCTVNAINEHLTVGNTIKESFRRRKYYFDEDSVQIFT